MRERISGARYLSPTRLHLWIRLSWWYFQFTNNTRRATVPFVCIAADVSTRSGLHDRTFIARARARARDNRGMKAYWKGCAPGRAVRRTKLVKPVRDARLHPWPSGVTLIGRQDGVRCGAVPRAPQRAGDGDCWWLHTGSEYVKGTAVRDRYLTEGKSRCRATARNHASRPSNGPRRTRDSAENFEDCVSGIATSKVVHWNKAYVLRVPSSRSKPDSAKGWTRGAATKMRHARSEIREPRCNYFRPRDFRNSEQNRAIPWRCVRRRLALLIFRHRMYSFIALHTRDIQWPDRNGESKLELYLYMS